MLVNRLAKCHVGGKSYYYKADKFGKHKYSINIYTNSIFFTEDIVALCSIFAELHVIFFIGCANNHPRIYVQ